MKLSKIIGHKPPGLVNLAAISEEMTHNEKPKAFDFEHQVEEFEYCGRYFSGVMYLDVEVIAEPEVGDNGCEYAVAVQVM